MAGQRQLETAPQASPVNRRHHWNRQALNFRHHLLPLTSQRLGLLRALTAANHINVGPGDKVIGFGGDKYHALQRFVIPNLFEDGTHLTAKLRL